MKNNQNKKFKWKILSVLILAMLILPFTLISAAWADYGVGFTVSPMKEKIVLNPGDEYSSEFQLSIPDHYENDMKYEIKAAPFFVDENYNKNFDEAYGTNSEMMKWITFQSPTEGRLSPGQAIPINFTINVPNDAPGGGQYTAIMVKVDAWTDEDEKSEGEKGDNEVDAAVKEEKVIAYTIYAEITGDIIRQGEILDANVPSFLLSGNITGSAAVKNTGNVHGDAVYKLQVFPLFSDEEVYTNEEEPQDVTVLPDRTRYEEIAWEQTPSIGIFNVVFTVEFEGATAQVSKMVIKCPIWLLFIVLFVIAALIIWIVMKVRARGKSGKKSEKKSEE